MKDNLKKPLDFVQSIYILTSLRSISTDYHEVNISMDWHHRQAVFVYLSKWSTCVFWKSNPVHIADLTYVKTVISVNTQAPWIFQITVINVTENFTISDKDLDTMDIPVWYSDCLSGYHKDQLVKSWWMRNG